MYPHDCEGSKRLDSFSELLLNTPPWKQRKSLSQLPKLSKTFYTMTAALHLSSVCDVMRRRVVEEDRFLWPSFSSLISKMCFLLRPLPLFPPLSPQYHPLPTHHLLQLPLQPKLCVRAFLPQMLLGFTMSTPIMEMAFEPHSQT